MAGCVFSLKATLAVWLTKQSAAQVGMVKVNSKFLKEQHPDEKLQDMSQLVLAAKEIDEVRGGSLSDQVQQA